MDQDTATLLTRWGLFAYVETFANAGIDIGLLRLIQQQEIQELIPCTGDRIKFKSNLAIWKKEIDGATSAYPTQENPVNVGSLSDVVDESILLNLDDFMNHTNNATAKKTTSLPVQNENPFTTQLRDLLRHCPDGRAILAYSENNNGKLDRRCRKQICNIIINHEMKEDNEVGISTHKFIAWAQAIASLFPTESQA
ncbi:uncharacterized protein LOC120356156, partial [Nilaparvata lugens]|uniref:uncharacterized protein LOC120356156 n=1 Tax=Nilaparvata lugens TaxID=108931 RepID=UPI00193DE0C9